MAQEASKAVAEHGAEGATASFPPFDASLFPHQIFWFALSFVGLYLIMAFIVLPKISQTIEKRKSTIADDLKRAQEESEAAEAARIAATEAQAKARNEARQTLDDMRKEIDAENAAASSAAISEAEEKIKAAEVKIAKQKDKAIAAVTETVGDLASDIFVRLTGAAPSAAALKAAAKGSN